MSDESTRFESFPNEILFTIFEYIDARDLYRSFYYLNYRINNILRSVNHLYILLGCIRFRNDIYDPLIASRVRALIVERSRVFDDFSYFTNVRSLIFLDGSEGDIISIIDRLPSIEYLSIEIKQNPSNLNNIFQRIFSNNFLRLKSCVINKLQPIDSIDQWQTSPMIKSLRIYSDHSHIHTSILNSCPNLHSFNLSIPTISFGRNSQQIHNNLKRLTLRMMTCQWPENSILQMFFCFIPNLQRLTIERLIENSTEINQLEKIHWLADIIIQCLSYLKFFRLILNFDDKQKWNDIDFKNLQFNFNNSHFYRYQHELIFK